MLVTLFLTGHDQRHRMGGVFSHVKSDSGLIDQIVHNHFGHCVGKGRQVYVHHAIGDQELIKRRKAVVFQRDQFGRGHDAHLGKISRAIGAFDKFVQRRKSTFEVDEKIGKTFPRQLMAHIDGIDVGFTDISNNFVLIPLVVSLVVFLGQRHQLLHVFHNLGIQSVMKVFFGQRHVLRSVKWTNHFVKGPIGIHMTFGLFRSVYAIHLRFISPKKKMKKLFTGKISKRFDQFNFSVPNVKRLELHVKQHSALKSALKQIFSKKAFVLATGSTLIGLGTHYVNEYIQENSGCFLYEKGRVHCKVKELSCCQPQPVHDVPFCSLHLSSQLCTGFDEDAEKSCCRLCDCQHQRCWPGQELKCRRPTVAEALSYFSKDFGFGWFFKMTAFVLLGCILLLFLLNQVWRR
ncbi:uncharacterized protein TNCT_729901 [Trichonephila clavata]|uniref:Uncharacterized protein n=1 Tax=Trichonephila clavata TaxID=2740835 RepID=A0A8X6GJD9_TRICU|nr:uncharacterized protein TNCT_729901 [Trichonephila clavata]